MATFVFTRATLWKDTASNALGFEYDGPPLIIATGGDYVADLPATYSGLTAQALKQTPSYRTPLYIQYFPSPFSLVRDIDSNRPPASRNAFNPGFD